MRVQEMTAGDLQAVSRLVARALFRQLGYRASMVEMTLDLPGAAPREK